MKILGLNKKAGLSCISTSLQTKPTIKRNTQKHRKHILVWRPAGSQEQCEAQLSFAANQKYILRFLWFKKKKNINRIDKVVLFSEPSLIKFTKGVNNSQLFRIVQL